MKRYVGILTNTYLNIDNVRLSDEAIRNILDRQTSVPVTVNFSGTVVGQTIRLFLNKNDMVGCEFEIDETRLPPIDNAYIVAGFENVQSHDEGRLRVIDNGDLTEVSINLLPVNPKFSFVALKKGK